MIADLSQLNASPTWDDATAVAAWLEEQDEQAARWLYEHHDPPVQQIVGARVACLGLAEDMAQTCAVLPKLFSLRRLEGVFRTLACEPTDEALDTPAALCAA